MGIAGFTVFDVEKLSTLLKSGSSNLVNHRLCIKAKGRKPLGAKVSCGPSHDPSTVKASLSPRWHLQEPALFGQSCTSALPSNTSTRL